jgi:hypothetical protein
MNNSKTAFTYLTPICMRSDFVFFIDIHLSQGPKIKSHTADLSGSISKGREATFQKGIQGFHFSL